MSTLFEQGGRVSLDWNTRNDGPYSLSVNAKNDIGAMTGQGYVVTFTIPSVAVARKLAELFDRYAELRELSADCAHAYLDVGDECAVCGRIITDRPLDYRNGCGIATK